MTNRLTAGASFIAGILITTFYFQFAHPSVPPLSPKECPPPKETDREVPECAKPNELPKEFSHEILPPPKFRAHEPPTYATNREGEAHVLWNQVRGAKSYRVILEDEHGKVVKTYATSHTSLYLKDIPMPEDNAEGTLHVRLASLNADDKMGEKGESRDLQLSRQAQVVAPTVKKITVED